MNLLKIFTLLLCCLNLSAQNIVDFNLINSVDQSTVSLSSYYSSKAIAIIFTSNNCPYAKLYEERILKLHSEYSSKGLTMLLVNPNNPIASPVDHILQMKDRAHEMNYPFPYLADSDQKVSKLFGAKKTPEAYLLKPNGQKFSVVYKGAIDDNPQNPSDIGEAFLKNAIEIVIKGESINHMKSRPVGCMIKS